MYELVVMPNEIEINKRYLILLIFLLGVRKHFWGSAWSQGAALGNMLNDDLTKSLRLKTMKRISHFVWLRKQFYQVQDLECTKISFFFSLFTVLLQWICYLEKWKALLMTDLKWMKNNAGHWHTDCWVWEILKSWAFKWVGIFKKCIFLSLSHDSFNFHNFILFFLLSVKARGPEIRAQKWTLDILEMTWNCVQNLYLHVCNFFPMARKIILFMFSKFFFFFLMTKKHFTHNIGVCFLLLHFLLLLFCLLLF